MSFTPVSNRWIEERTTRIAAKAIPWDGYQRAGLLAADDVALIQRVAGQKAQADAILAAEAETYASLYIRLLNKLSRNDTIQYILVLIGDMIADHDERIPLFLTEPETLYSALLKLLESPDEYIRLKTSVITSTFLSSDPKPSDNVVSTLLGDLSALIRNDKDVEGQDIGVQCLEGVLRIEKVRTAVWAAESKDSQAPKIIEGLVQLLRSNPTSQMQYQLAFCFWLLTFDAPTAKAMNSKYTLIPLLADLARNAVKEKVIRMVVATFRNLITIAPKENLPSMLVAKLLPFVKTLAQRKWSDEEIKEDIDFLVEQLKESFEGLTTYDEYTSELQSGQLSWTPPHQNEDFWRENGAKLNAKDFEQLKVLINLLNVSKDSLVLAVAANDIGQYVKYCSSGKKAIEDLGAKGRVMELMGHPDADVKYQSLIAVQRLISTSYA